MLKNNTQDPIIKNMITLASGTAGAQLLGLLFMPVVVRLYSPSDFGLLAIFTSILSLLEPFNTFRYTVAIPLPKLTQTAMNIVALSILLSLSMSVVLGLILLIGSDYLFALFSAEALAPYRWLLVIGLFSNGLYSTLLAWSTREKHFATIAKTKIQQSVSSTIVKVLFALLGYKPMGLLVAQVVSLSAGTRAMFSVSKEEFLTSKRFISKKRMIFLAKRYSHFPRYQIVSKVLLSFSVQLPLLFVAWMYDSAVTGQLSLALMVLSLPVNLIGNTMGQAFYGEVAQIGRRNTERIRSITHSLIKKLFWISLIPFLILLVGGEFLFSFIFGEQWVLAGTFTSSLSLLLVSRFISSPFVNLLNLYERQPLLLQINLIRLLLMGLIFSLSTYYQVDVLTMIWGYSISLSFHYLYTLKVILKSIH
jgi:O-antigen/teichoic acid export membrane protein